MYFDTRFLGHVFVRKLMTPCFWFSGTHLRDFFNGPQSILILVPTSSCAPRMRTINYMYPSSNTHPKINICFVLLVLISNERLPPLPTTLGWLAGWLVGRLGGWLGGWLSWAGCLLALVGWLFGWLAGWLVGWIDMDSLGKSSCDNNVLSERRIRYACPGGLRLAIMI